MRAALAALCLAVAVYPASARQKDPIAALAAGVGKAFAPPPAHRSRHRAKTRHRAPQPVKAAKVHRPSSVSAQSAVKVKHVLEITVTPTVERLEPGATDKFNPALAEYYKPIEPRPTGWSQSGIASWYGPGFSGRLTACGAIKGFVSVYIPAQLTAAHKSLPCGTKVEVHANGRTVDVTITDRGPYVAGRIIDLSQRAAADLGMRPGEPNEQGIAKATIYVLSS